MHKLISTRFAGYAGRRLQEGYDSFEIKPGNSGSGSVPSVVLKGVSHTAGAFVIRSVDQGCNSIDIFYPIIWPRT